VEDVVQGRGQRASCTQNTHRIEDAATQRQQHCNMISGHQLVVQFNAKYTQTGHMFDAWVRQWGWRSLVTCQEDDLLHLVTI